MIAYRGALAAAMIVIGAVVTVRVLGYGVRIETLPGIVLGAAMIALGVHRLRLIWDSVNCHPERSAEGAQSKDTR
jgi:hypothetical protein